MFLTACLCGALGVGCSQSENSESLDSSHQSNSSVEEVDDIVVTASDLKLATAELDGDVTSDTVTAWVTVNGQAVQNPVFTYGVANGENVLSVTDSGVVTAVLTAENAVNFVGGEYSSKITVCYGDTTAQASVTVIVPVVETSFHCGEVVAGSFVSYGEFGLGDKTQSIFHAEDESNVNAITAIEGGLVYGDEVWGERKAYLYTEEGYRLQVGVCVITKVITNHNEFVNIFLTATNSGQQWSDVPSEDMNYEGYYVLGNDIQFPSGIAYLNKYRPYFGGTGISIPDGCGFNGVFDGRGHTVSGLAITNGGKYNESTGIFSTIGKNGVVKNVAFVNGTIHGVTGVDGVASYFSFHTAGLVQDVFIHIDMTNSTVKYSISSPLLKAVWGKANPVFLAYSVITPPFDI